jgi:tyrosinase
LLDRPDFRRTPTNMGRVPYAGGDPIFWLHHCNIDRLWESWDRLPGRTNPVWPSRSFVFANAAGGTVIAPVAGADRVALLHYQYDNYYVPSGAPVALAAPQLQLAVSPAEVQALVAAPVTLGSSAVRAPLTTPAPTLTNGAAPTLRLAAPPASRNLYLILGGIDAMTDPGSIVYNVFLDLPEGTAPSESDPHYVGSLNFFNAAVGHDGHDQGGGHGHTIAFNVTNVVKALQASNKLSDKPTVTLVPNGELSGGAAPTVNEISLVEA